MRIRFEKFSGKHAELELIAVSLAVLALVVGWAILLSGIQLPACNFRQLTGYPCPGCGGTRACLLLASFHVRDSFRMNPLAAALCVAGGLFALYSAIVLVFRLPVFRLSFSSRRERRIFWLAFAVAALINWAYLIAVGR